MNLKTCLLVTDDPDDHQAFSEALSEITSNAVVLIVLDSEKALQLLKSGKYFPDYVFLDLSMHGIRINTFLKAMKSDGSFRFIPTVVYGGESAFEKIEHRDGIYFFNKEYDYSELRNFLAEFIQSGNGNLITP
jgi:CheY-like chemotaxis protein